MNIAEKLLPLALAHQKADEYTAGRYGGPVADTFRGCSIGCTIWDAKKLNLIDKGVLYGDHEEVANLLFGGVEQIAHLQDAIFEGLPSKDRPTWTPRLLVAIKKAPSKINWQNVWHKWATWLMNNLLDIPDLSEDVQQAIRSVRDLHQASFLGLSVDEEDWREAAEAARAASRAASRAAEAAEAASRAAEAAEAAAEAAWAAEAAEAAAWGVSYQQMADALIGAISEEPNEDKDTP